VTSLDDWTGLEIPEVVMEDAAGWMALLDSERCNEASHLAFANWLNEDPCHRMAFEELSEVWAKLRTLSDVEPLLDQPKVVRFPGSSISEPRALAATCQQPGGDWSALATVIMVMMGAAVHVALDTPAEVFATRVGESRDIVLGDASVLEMNARTAMEVSIDEGERRISLLSGEVVFHVAKDDRPFIVQTEYGNIAALGTTFAVEAGDGSLQVTVIEGSVSVTGAYAHMPLTEYDEMDALGLSQQVALLEAGERLVLVGDRYQQRTVTSEELEKQLSWRDGVVEFDDQPLYLVVDKLRRYTETSIHIADNELRDLRISGRFETGDISHFLAQLDDNYPIFVDDQNSDLVVLRSGR
jgi:transmembrane sensor